LPAELRLWAADSVGRQTALVLRITVVVRVEEGTIFSPAADGARVAEKAISGLLAESLSFGEARPAENLARVKSADQADVGCDLDTM
jgi:hypothetical protein